MPKGRPVAVLPLLVPVVLLGLLGCGPPRQLPAGESYESISGARVVRVKTATELDYVEDGHTFAARYSIEEDRRIRMVVLIFGMENVLYFTPSEGRLVSDGGMVLYPIDQIGRARDSHYCGMVEDEGFQLTSAQDALGSEFLVSGDGRRLDRLENEVTRSLTGVQGKWFAVLAQHQLCSQAYLWSSEQEQGREHPSMLDLDDARDRFGELTERAAREAREIARRRAEAEARARAEAARLARERLYEVLTSGKAYFGSERLRRHFPFRIRFENFDSTERTFQGKMDYFPPNDRSILWIAGEVRRTELHFSHTKVEREGTSAPEWHYVLTFQGNELRGKCRRKDGNTGEVRIGLEEDNRRAKLDEVNRFEKDFATLLSSRTPSRTVYTGNYRTPSGAERGKVVVSDVGITIEPTGGLMADHKSAQIIFFDEIDRAENEHCRSFTPGSILRGPGLRTRVGFGGTDKVSRCRDFAAAVNAALSAWERRHPGVRAKWHGEGRIWSGVYSVD